MTRQAALVEEECEYSAVDTSNDSVTVFNGPCIYYGAVITTTLSAHTVLVKDGAGATIDHYASTAAAGTIHSFPNGIRCATSLVVDPDNSSTGNMTVFFRRARPG